MTNQQGAPEALRPEMLDDLIETFATAGLGRHNLMRVELPRHQWAQLAVALSRLHAENERLAALVEAQQPAPSAAACVICGSDEPFTGTCGSSDPRALCKQPASSAAAAVNPDPHAELRKTWQPGQRWQARSFRNGQWGPWTDAVASEPFWFPHQDYRRHPDDLAPQPSPTAQAASSAVLKAIRAANMQLVRTGDDEFMLVTYKQATPQADSAPTSVEDAETKQAGFAHSDWSFKAEVLDTSPPSAGEKFLEEPDVQDESGLNKYYSRELVLDCIEDALASKAAPQADSQPAPVRDYPPLPKPDCPNIWGGAYSKNQMRAYVDADRAARAPADSVTAPAGGEIARLRAQVETLTRDCGRQASKIAELIADLKFQDGKHREDRAQLQTIYEHQRGECWYWQGDGQDHLESLCNTLPVVIRADQLRALVTTPPAQAADSVLEDAARLLRQILAASQDGDSDTHLSAHFVSRIETITKAGGAA